MAYDPVTKIYTPEYTPNPDAYIKKLRNQGMSKADAAASARYQAQADIYFAPTGPGANIDPLTGGLRTPPEVVSSGFPVAGTFAGYEYSADKKQRRAKYHDGKGGFTYGPFEANPDYKDDTSTDRRDAFSMIKSTLLSYGFTEEEMKELDSFIESMITDVKIGPELAKIKLREQKVYQARFAGNKGRVAKGFNALTEAQYLQQETDYAQTLNAYGVGQLSSRNQFATLIENNTSVSEVGRRLNASVRRVKNADPTILSNIRTLYPTITDTDIVSYFLKPIETVEELERKTTVAEIGATAQQYGMKQIGLANLTRFEDLERYGVDLAEARKGYSTIAEELPTATKLSNIYGETGINYGQTEAEQDQFKKSQEAKRKKQKLISSEELAFKGSSGTGLSQGALSTQYLRRGSSGGQF